MDDFVIRKATESDVKPLADMDKICFNLPWSEASFFEEIVNNKVAKYFVAEVSGKMVGYAGLWVVLDEGHITNIAVHPEFRRKGIAKALICKMMSAAEDAGATVFTLEVRALNKSAIALYEQFNFKIVGLRKNYYQDNGEDAAIMWKL
jgi:ribosomal-protein-alanine N-acetyltransferase